MPTLEFDPRVLDAVQVTRDRLQNEGKLLPREVLDGYLTRFRAKFGPETLARLDGTALLDAMHARSRDSLMYWLEFKNDDDFASPLLGSISGGSALKFGIYQRAENGAWMTGSSRQQMTITRAEAIATARKQRDELLAAVNIVEGLSPIATFDPADLAFDTLDERLATAMPSLYSLAWSHKYLSLLFPDRVDFYHVYDHQAFHQVRMLLRPPHGRYAAGQAFAALARILGEPMQHVGVTLIELHGDPYSYWRLGTVIRDQSRWDAMRSGGYAAVGWTSLGDLSDVAVGALDKDAWRERFAKTHAHENPSTESNQRGQVLDFVRNARERDVVIAVDGKDVLGIGSITGPYEHHPERDGFPHSRAVEWRSDDKWTLDEGLRTTFRRLKDTSNWVTVERHLFDAHLSPTTSGIAIAKPATLPALDPTIARVDRVLRRKGQVILYGPPGTGKTHWGERAAFELASRAWFERAFDAKDAANRAELIEAGAVEACSFHPAYGYEEFLEGYRPRLEDGAMAFSLRDGIFKRLCARAAANPTRPFYLLIDEINRGDIPRIFGELLTALEIDKRGKSFSLPLSADAFAVPNNLFVIGTMNTADRSIALLDAALRRRFGFVELMPSAEPLRSAVVNGLPLGPWLVALNRRILQHVGRDARNLQIGHAYLLERGSPVSTPDRFAEVLQEDVVPLLQEYCYDDYPLLEKILGKGLVDAEHKRIKDALFDPSRRQDLFAALIAEFPDLTTSAEVLAEPDEDDEGDTEPST